MRQFAERLIAHEIRGKSAADLKVPVAFVVCEKLRPHLATLMGNAGFRVLLSRALSLASSEVPWLRAVRVQADGSLAGLEEVEAQVQPGEFAEDSVVLLAQLLTLLAAFIGENLTIRVVGQVWPKMPLEDLDAGQGKK
jgi:hypothetical protein